MTRKSLRAVEPAPELPIPQADAAECALLGAILLDRTVLPTVRLIVEPGDFRSIQRRAVFEAMLAIADRGGRADDPITVAAEASRRARDVTHVALLEFVDQVATVMVAPQWARLILDASVRRAVIGIAQRFSDDARLFQAHEVIERAQIELARLAARVQS